jgi:aminopeptidase-like protein
MVCLRTEPKMSTAPDMNRGDYDVRLSDGRRGLLAIADIRRPMIRGRDRQDARTRVGRCHPACGNARLSGAMGAVVVCLRECQ